MRREAIVPAALVAVLILAVAGKAVAPIIKESYEKTDPGTMRAYRMSPLTDAQVLELHARAVEESAKQKRAAEEQDKAFWAGRDRAMRECESSPASKLRDPDHLLQTHPSRHDGRRSSGFRSNSGRSL